VEIPPVDATPGRSAWVEAGPDGELRLAFQRMPEWGYGHAAYARRTTQGWVVETVTAEDGTGKFPCLTFDDSNPPQPHMTYSASDLFFYSTRSEMGWRTETLRTPTGGQVCSGIAMDPDGVPQIGYLSAGDGVGIVRYFTRTGSSWEMETVHMFPDTSDSHASLGFAVDSQWRPHAACTSRTNGDVFYAVREAGGWRIETVERAGASATHINLALDSQERPVLAYFADDTHTHALRLARRMADGWQFQVLMTGRNYGFYDFCVDPMDRVHLISYRWPGMVLTYGLFDGESWRFEEPAGGLSYWIPGITSDSTGRPYLGFGRRVSGEWVCVAWPNGSTWMVETIVADDEWDAEMAVDGNDRPYFSYISFLADLFVAYRDLEAARWELEQVSSDVLYSDQDLAVTEQGEVFVTAMLDSTKELRLFRRDAVGWSVETIDTRMEWGHLVTMGLNGEDPYVYYVDDENSGVYCRKREGGVWGPVEQVLPPDMARSAPDAEVGPDGTEHLVFYTRPENAAIYGRRQAGGAWQFERIDSETGKVTAIRLHLNSAGDPVIVYFDRDYQDLKLARWLPPTATWGPSATPSPRPTRTPSPTATASITPSPTPTASPSATPTLRPSATATATAAPTATRAPTPDRIAPYVLLGGWAGTDLEADRPGSLTLAALVEGTDVARVVLTTAQGSDPDWQVEDLDLEMERYPEPLPGFPEEIGLYLFTLEGVSLPAGRWLPCGIRAYDQVGNRSECWPFLEAVLRPGGPGTASCWVERLPELAQVLRREHQERVGGEAGEEPEILLGGWLETRWWSSGPVEITLLAFTDGPEGRTWLADAAGKSLGVEVPSLPGTGCYLLTAEVADPYSVKSGRYLVGMFTETDKGARSSLWPYLEVLSPAAPTPSPTPTRPPEPATATPRGATPAPSPTATPATGLEVSFQAQPEGVQVPVDVVFAIQVRGAGPEAAYLLDFADGEWRQGPLSELVDGAGAAEVRHRYQIHHDREYVTALEITDAGRTVRAESSFRLRGENYWVSASEWTCPGNKPGHWDCGTAYEDKVNLIMPPKEFLFPFSCCKSSSKMALVGGESIT